MSKSKAKPATPRVFVPLTKIDEAQRLIYGTITAQELDQSGETMNYEASKPNFEKWSNDIHTASGGLSKGNVRVMHGLSVAGKLTDLAFDDDSQSIEVCAKIVDDGEWEKCLEGCYTGFSVGGRYGKRWTEDGTKYFEAMPNEVSIVDNPCVKSATFALLKADGTEEQLSFSNLIEEPTVEEPAGEETAVVIEPGNDAVVAKATEIALAKADGTTWMDHIHDARELLIKVGAKPDTKTTNKTVSPNEAKEGDNSGDVKPANKVFDVADQLKQVWTTTDGKGFEKKADAEAHQATLAKAANTSEIDQLKERLAKATEPKADPVVVDLMDDWDRLAKAIDVVTTPMVDGAPVLAKGMYTVGTFSRLLCDMGTLAKSIAAEGAVENNESSDKEVSAEIKAAMNGLGDSFKKYVADQVEELLAGLDDETYVSYYDYYYAAVTNDGEDSLAKDICSLLTSHKDSSRLEREELAKAFGLVEAEVVTEELSPPMQKRFETLETENADLKKIAGEAIEKVEALAKQVQTLADTPLPRAPNPGNVAMMHGDGGFFGKRADTEVERLAVLQEMLTTHGPDRMAEIMIKAVHSGGGQKLLPRGA